MRNKDIWTGNERTELVLSILSGEITAEQATRQHALPMEEIESWITLYLSAAKQAVASSRTSFFKKATLAIERRPIQSASIILAVLLVALISKEVVSQQTVACDPSGPLLCFNANTPAKANEVNSNFANLLNWLEGKIGSVDNNTVTFMSTDVLFAADSRGIGGRAFVHDEGNTIVINYAGDFEGGVRIDSPLNMNGPLTMNGSLTMNAALNFNNNTPLNLFTISDVYNANRENALGTNSVDMTPIANSICFLTKTSFGEIDNGIENATCEVTQSGSAWRLDAVLNKEDDADAYCSARCLSW